MTEHVQRTEGRVCLTTAFDVCNPADVRVEWLPVAPGMGIGDLLERQEQATLSTLLPRAREQFGARREGPL